MSPALVCHRRAVKSSEASDYVKSSPANEIAVSLNRSEEGVLQRPHYDDANALSGDKLEKHIAHFDNIAASIAHETRNDVPHEGNLRSSTAFCLCNAASNAFRC